MPWEWHLFVWGFMEIEGRKIGPDQPPYIIAEMSNNHLGSLDRAKDIICAAKEAGADAVKIQTFEAEDLTIDARNPEFHLNTPLWKGRTYYQLYREIAFPMEKTSDLFSYARNLGITLFSSPFGKKAVELLTDLGCPAFKIASFEAVDPEFIRLVAGTGKPVLMSTGVSSFEELDLAMGELAAYGAGDVLLFHCVSQYPAPMSSCHLNSMETLKSFSRFVGLSDHTLDHTASLVAVSKGGCAVEKHFTLSRKDGGPDAAFSIEPGEMLTLKQSCLAVWDCLGRDNIFMDGNRSGREHSRSLYVVKDVGPGEPFTRENIRSIRPGFGLAPANLEKVLGRIANCRLCAGSALKWEHIR